MDKSAPFSSADTKQHSFFSFIWNQPRRPRGGQSGGKKRRDESFQVKAEKPLGTDSHRIISKRSSECWFLIGHKKCFALLCPIGEQLLLRSFRESVHDGYFLATVARFVHQAFLTRNEESTDESKTFRMLSAGANSVSDGPQCIVNNRKFKMQRRRESKKSNSLTRQNKFARASRLLYISLPSLRDYLVKMPNFTFCEGRKQAMTKFILFMNLDMVNRNSAPEEFACIWQSKWVGIIAIETEKMWIHFSCDVFDSWLSAFCSRGILNSLIFTKVWSMQA